MKKFYLRNWKVKTIRVGLLSVCFLFLSHFSLLAQSEGDYRTNATGAWNWSNSANWEVYTSGSWVTATEYPGQSGGTGEVTINDGAQITLDLSPANPVSSLIFADGTTLATDITFSGFALSVSGAVTFGIPVTDAGDQFIYLDDGTLNAGSVTMLNTGNNAYDTEININNGALTVVGNIIMTNGNRNAIRFSGTGTVTVGGDFYGGTFARGSSTVTYNGAGAQQVGNYNYNNLILTNSGVKTLRANTNIYGDLTLGSVLDVSNRQLYLSNASDLLPETSFGASAMLDLSNGGYLCRDGNTTTDFEMVYPVGTGSDYTPLELTSVTASDASGRLYIYLYAERNMFTAGTDNALTRYWKITNTGLTFTSVSGSFTYSDNDVLPPIVESNLTTVGRFDGGDWQQNEAGISHNHGTNQMTISGASELFGEWTLGEATGCFDGLPSGKFTVQDGAWNNGATWNGGVVPLADGSEDVTVFHNLGNLNADINVNSLTFESGSYLNFYNRNVTVVNDLLVGDYIRDSNNTGTVSIGGNLTINSGGQYNIERGLVSVTGDVTVAGILRDSRTENPVFTIGGSLNINDGGNYNLEYSDVTVTGDVIVAGVMDDSQPSGSLTINSNLQIDATGDFNIQNNTLNVSGTTTVYGVLQDTDGDGMSTFGDLVTVESGGTFSSNNYDFDFQGGLENNGTFINSSSYNLNTDLTVTGTSELQFTDDLYIADNVTLTNENTGGITITDVLDGLGANAALINKGLINYNDYAREPMLTGTMDCSTFENTFVYTSGNRQYIKAIPYYNLTCSNDDDKELQGTTTVLNNLTTSGTADFECNGNDLVLSGSVSHTSTGAFTTGSNTVTYNGAGDQNILDISYDGHLIIGGSGTKSLQNTTSVVGNITVQGTGVLSLNGQQFISDGDISISNGATFEIDDNAQLELADAATLTNNGIFRVVGTAGNEATVTTSGSGGYLISQLDAAAEFHALYAVFDGTGGITITDGVVDNTNNFSYTTFSNGTGQEYLQLTDWDPIGGLSAVQSAVFETGPTFSITRISGTNTVTFVQATGSLSGENFDNDNGNPGTLIEWTDPASIFYSTGDVPAGLTSSWTRNPNGTGGNPASVTDGTVTLIVQDGHTVTLDSNGDVDVRKLIVGQGTSGSFIIGGDATQQVLTVQELLQVQSGASLVPGSEGAPAHILRLYGNLINNGTINLQQTFTTVANTELFGNMEISGSSTPVFNNLTFAAGCTAVANLPLDINRNLYLEAGAEFNDGGYTHTLEFNWNNNGGTYTATGDLVLDGGTSSIVQTGTSTTFNNLTFNSGGLNTIKEAIIVNGDFIVSNNTRISAGNVPVSINGNFNVGAGSEYIQTQNTTSFDGITAQAINFGGTTAFYNVSFTNGGAAAKTVTGNINADGRVTIDTGATVDGNGDHVIDNGLHVDGTCNFSGSITLTGNYLESSNPSPATFTLGTASLIIDGNVSLRHTSGGSTLTVTVQNDVSIVGGYLVLNDGVQLVGQPGNTLSLDPGRILYVRGADNFPTGFGTFDFDPTAWVIYDANMDQTVRGGFSYGQLRVQYANKTVDGPLTITGLLDLNNSCNLDLQNYTHTFSGTTLYNGNQNGSIDGSSATFIIGDVDFDQTIQANGTGSYVFNNLIIRQNGATTTRTKTFDTGCNLTVTNDFTIENTGGTEAIQLIVNLNNNAISGPANDFSLGSYCQVNTDHPQFGPNVLDSFTGTRTIDLNSTVYYSLNGEQYIADGITYGNVMFYSGNKIAEGVLDINGNLMRNGTPEFFDGGFTHTIAGDWGLDRSDSYTQTSATGTIVFDGADQNIDAYNFNNIVIANSGAANLVRDLNIFGNLTVNDGSTFDASTLDMNIGGNITVNGSGVYSQTTGITTVNGDANQTITMNALSDFGYLTINKTNPGGQTVTVLSELYINENAIITASAGILDITNQQVYFGNNLFVYQYAGVPNFITTGSTAIFNGTQAQTIRNYHADNLVFNNLVFQGGGDKTFEYNNPNPELASQIVEVHGDFTINGSVVNGNTMDIYVQGNWSNNGTFQHARTVYFNGGDQNISSTGFYHVNFQGSGTKTLTGNISVTNDLYIDGTATLAANGNNITIGDDWFNEVVGANFSPGTGKVTFNGSGGAEIFTGTTSGAQPGKIFNTVDINVTGTATLQGDFVVANDLNIVSGTLRTDENSVWVGGDFINSDTYYCNNDASILTLNGSGGSKTFNPNGATFRGVVLDAPGTTYELGGDFTIDNVDMQLNAGTLNLNEYRIIINDNGRSININGATLNVEAGSVIEFTHIQSLNLISGVLSFVGEEGNTADLINSSTNGSRIFTINASGGTVHASYYRIQQGEIVLSGTAAIDGTNNFSNGTFTNGYGTGAYLTLTGIDFADFSVENLIFNAGPQYNISRTSGTGTLIVQDASGGIAGELYENDEPGNTLIDWTFPAGFFWDGGDLTDNTDWNRPNNWEGNTVPGINNIVYLNHKNVAGPYSVVIFGTDGACRRLNITDASGTNAIDVTVGTNTSLDVQEHLSIGANTSLSQVDNTALINVGQNWTNLGTYNHGNSTLTFTASSGNYILASGGTGAGKAFYNVAFIAGTSLYKLDAPIELQNDLTITQGTLDLASPNNDITVGGDWYLDQGNGGAFIPANADVTFDGSDQTITNGTFYNLVIAGTGTKTVDSNIAVENNLTINGGASLAGQENNLYVRRNWQNDGGSFSQTGFGAVIFDGTATQYVDNGTAPTTFNNLIFSNNGAKYISNDLSISGNVLINSGSGLVNLQTYQLTGIGASNEFTCNDDLQIEGINNFPSGFETLSFDAASTVNYYADIDQEIYATTYGNLRLRRLSDGVSMTKTAMGNLEIIGSLYLDGNARGAILDMVTNDANITLTGNLSVTSGSSIAWGTGNATLEHVGGNWYIDEDIAGFNHLILAGTGDKYTRGDLHLTGDLVVRSNVDLRLYRNNDRNQFRLLTGTATGTFTTESGARVFDPRPATDGVAIPEGFGTYDLNENSTYYLYSLNNVAQTVYTGSNIAYGNLTFSSTKNVTSDGVAILNIDGDWDIASATFYDNGQDIEVAGANIYLTRYVPSSNDRTITLDGLRDQIIRDDVVNNFQTANIVFTGTGVKTIGDGSDGVTINGNLTIASGVTALTSRNITFNGANWTNHGYYTQTSGTLTFNGASDQTINPGTSHDSNYFNNIAFDNTSTKTFITNGADVNGDLIINDGTVDLGNLSYTIYDELTNTSGGTLISGNANINFDGGYQEIESPGFEVNNVTFSNTARKRMYNDWVINGNLLNESGVEFNTQSYNISIKGNWTNNGTFVDNTSAVTFSGSTATTTITSGGANFYNVDFLPTAAVTYQLLSPATRFDNVLNVGANATLDLNGKTLTLGRNNASEYTHTINGALTVDEGASLVVNNYPQQAVIDVYGQFNLLGTNATNVATLTSENTDNRDKTLINVRPGGTLAARYYLIEYVADAGINMMAGSILNATNNLSDGTWLNLRDQQDARYLILEADYAGGTITNVSFNYSGVPSQGRHYNVQRQAAATPVTFDNVTGAVGSYRFEEDDQAPSEANGLLRWPAITESYWTGAIDVDWHKAGNWDNGVPTSNIDAIIPDVSGTTGNSPIIFSGDATCKNLVITDGTLRVESGRNLTASGDVTISDGLLFNNSATSTITVGGDWQIGAQGNFSHGDGTVVFNSSSGSANILPGTSSFYNVTFNNVVTQFDITAATMDVEGDFIIQGGTVSPSTTNYVYNLAGDYTISGGSFSTTTNGTIWLNSTGDQTITNATFDNLQVAGSGNKLFNGSVTVDDQTTIVSTLSAQAGSVINFKGDMNLTATGTFYDGDQSHYFSGSNWNGDGAYAGNGTVTFNKTNGNQNLYGATFNNLVVDCTGRVFYLEGAVTVNGDLTFKGGISRADLKTNIITGTGAGTFTVESGVTIYVYGADNFPKGFGAYNLDASSTTRYEGSANQMVGGVAYGHLVLNNANTKTLSGATTVKGNLSFNAATLDVSTNHYSLTVGGAWTNNSSGHFVCRNGEVIFNNTSNLNITVGATNTNQFYNLTVNGSAVVSANNNTSNNFVVQNNLHVTSGQYNANGRTIYVGGDLLASGAGTFNNNTGLYYLNKASGTASIGVNGSSLLDLTINSGATYTVQDEINAVGSFNLLAGTFDGNGNTINLGNGTNDVININGTYKVGSNGVLGIGNGTTLNVSVSGRMEVVGSETGLARVTNNASGGRYNFTVDGEIAAEYYLFEYMSSGGIYLSPSSTIDATYHFSYGTFSNGANSGQLFRVENTQSFTEGGGNRIVNVSFPNNPGGSAANVAKYTAGSGTLEFYNSTGVFAGENYDNDPNNLIDWTGPVSLTWNGSVSTNWNTANNWTASSGPAIVPTSANNVVIAAAVNQPVLTTFGQECGNLTINSGAEIRLNTPDDAGAIDLDVNGDITIDGTLRTISTTDYITVEGNWTRSASGVVLLNGNVTFDGTGGASVIDNRTSAFYSLTIGGTSQYQLGNATTVNNDVVIIAGATLGVGPADYSLTVKGNFLNSGTFIAQQGTVVFSATSGPKTIQTGSSSFYDVDVNSSGIIYNLSSDVWVTEELKILAGTVDLQTNTLRVGNGSGNDAVSISGTLLVNANATLDMANNAKLNVNSGGFIELLGDDKDNRAFLTSSTAGRYSFDVNSGGSIKASFYTVEYTDADGLYMHPGANIDATYNLSDGTFSNGYPGSGSYMTLLHEMGPEETLRNLVFNDGPAYCVSRTSGTTIFHFEDASGVLGNYLYEKDDEVTPSPSSGLLRWPFVNLYTWEGDVNNDWFEAGNWYDDQLPIPTADVTIAVTGTDPVIDNSALVEVHGVTIDATATLTLEPGSKMTVADAIITNDGLIVQNTEDQPASFINDGNITGNVQVNWTYNDANRYYYIGHSLTGLTYEGYDVQLSNLFYLYRYNGGWTEIINGNIGGVGNELLGYTFKATNVGDLNLAHTGILNSSSYALPINGWHLIANPYQSYIDVESASFNIGNALPSTWISTNASGELVYATYNMQTHVGANGGSRYIAPGQAFWLRNYSASTFAIDPVVRTHGNGAVLKTTHVEPNDILRVNLSKNGLSDEAVMVFRPEGTFDASNGDSQKRMGSCNKVPNVYVLKGAQKTVISLFPQAEMVSSIPLGFKVGDGAVGELTFNATNIEQFDPDIAVELEDVVTGQQINLREQPQYMFMAEKGIHDNRLILHFSEKTDVVTDVEEEAINQVEPIKIYSTHNKVVVKITDEQYTEEVVVSIYTVQGQKIVQDAFKGNFKEYILPVAPGHYLVRVKAKGHIRTVIDHQLLLIRTN